MLDEQNLIVNASGRRHYHVVLNRLARGLNHSHGISFDATAGRVCAGFGNIVYGGMSGSTTQTTRIQSVRQIDPDEEEYLLIQFGKKEPEIKQTPVPQEVEGAEVEELDTAASE